MQAEEVARLEAIKKAYIQSQRDKYGSWSRNPNFQEEYFYDGEDTKSAWKIADAVERRRLLNKIESQKGISKMSKTEAIMKMFD